MPTLKQVKGQESQLENKEFFNLRKATAQMKSSQIQDKPELVRLNKFTQASMVSLLCCIKLFVKTLFFHFTFFLEEHEV